MLRNQGWLTLIAFIVIGILGCGKTESPVQSSAKSPDGNVQTSASANMPSNKAIDDPKAACHEFLDALRTGNDEKAARMLSTMAREKATALNRSVTPSASDTARFTLGKVNYVGEDGAQVESTWSDVDDSGQYQSDTALWVLRREEQGWRVVGVAWTIFPGEPPLLLNFEDPDEMLKKQQWAREEIRRRAEQENSQAKEPEISEKSMFR